MTGPGPAVAAVRTAVRSAVGAPVAAVLVCREVPVDIRQKAKIDGGAGAEWAADRPT